MSLWPHFRNMVFNLSELLRTQVTSGLISYTAKSVSGSAAIAVATQINFEKGMSSMTHNLLVRQGEFIHGKIKWDRATRVSKDGLPIAISRVLKRRRSGCFVRVRSSVVVAAPGSTGA